MESTLKNMVLTLFVITLVASTAVGFVYKVTEGPIAASEAAKTTNAPAQVLPSFDNDPSAERQEMEQEGLPVIVYTAKSGDQIVGYAVETRTSKGFGGEIVLMVGFKPDGEIVKIETLKHSETPGLGDKIDSKKSNFSVQFSGKNPADFKLAVKKDGGDVDAITASTISSRAFSDAVLRGYNALMTLTGGQVNSVSGATSAAAAPANESDDAQKGGENE